MVGLIQTVLMNLVEAEGGPTATADVRRMAGVPEDRVFRIDENYDDAEFRRLLVSTCERLGLTTEQAVSAFARAFYEDSIQRWPTWFKLSGNAREFLKRQPTIHNGFATGVTDSGARAAIRDKFKLTEADDRLIVRYKSPNQLCGVYVELASIILSHYGETATIEQPRCAMRGDEACEIHIIWPSGDVGA